MIRQYRAQRCRGGDNPWRIGTVPAGAIFYLFTDDWWRDRCRGRPVFREPWIVEGFLNGTIGAGRRDPATGVWESVVISGRSDMAVVRSLRTGRRRQIAVRLLLLHDDAGFRVDEETSPTLPAIRPSRTSVPAAASARPG